MEPNKEKKNKMMRLTDLPQLKGNVRADRFKSSGQAGQTGAAQFYQIACVADGGLLSKLRGREGPFY